MKKGIFVATPAYGGMCYLPYVDGLLELQRACLSASIEFDYFYVSVVMAISRCRGAS
ncbi:hypothetical protein [Burkholderia ubonensis]|uniref:hypothetical protein n=1 Tax=Burkholderia ubonensis TaxID=101571 RepID=UPI000B02A19A|nr:hypothetical protein [Burkholderia ubonensis]